MYSTEHPDKSGSQLQKEQQLYRYKQFLIVVWYTILETYFISVLLKSTNMAVNLFICGTAIMKPKDNNKDKTISKEYRTLRSSSHPSNDSESCGGKRLVPSISIEDCTSSANAFDTCPPFVNQYSDPSTGLTFSTMPEEHILDGSLRVEGPLSAEQQSLNDLNVCQNSNKTSFQVSADQSVATESNSQSSIDHQIKEQGTTITSCELVSLINNREAVLLLDCRTFMAFNTNHISGAVNVCCSDRITKKRLADGKICVGDVVSGQEGKDLYRRLEAEAEIVVYDESSTELDSVQVGHPLKVVTECLEKHGRRARLLIGGLQAFQQSYSCMCSQPDPACCAQLLYSPTSPEVNCDIDAAVASEILPFLYIGNQRDASNKERLAELGITHIINVTAQLPLHFESDGSIRYKRLPATDSGSQNLKQYFSEAIEFIDNARDSNGKVLVHCQAGVSRSPTIVLAYLMARTKKGLTETFNLVKDLRPIVAPNLNFMGQLLEFEQLAIQRSGLCPPSQPIGLLRL